MLEQPADIIRNSVKDPTDTTAAAVIRITATYQPAGGAGASVAPPTFMPDPVTKSPYLFGERIRDGEPHGTVMLDQVQSQANRAEQALLDAYRSKRVRVPFIELQVPEPTGYVITSLDAPHRYADGFFKASEIKGGEAFDRTEVGAAIVASSSRNATALYEYDPGSLVWGAWNSHRAGRQEKFPRIYSSEVIGWDPVRGVRAAGRMDPSNLIGQQKPNGDGWDYLPPTGEKTKGSKLSEIGLGNIPPSHTPVGGVSITSATRTATIHFAALRRLRFGDAGPEATAAARATLAAYALMTDRLAFGGPDIFLRSGCDLVVSTETMELVYRGEKTEAFDIDASTAIDLFNELRDEAARLGIEMKTEPFVVVPQKGLAQAIAYSLTRAEPED